MAKMLVIESCEECPYIINYWKKNKDDWETLWQCQRENKERKGRCPYEEVDCGWHFDAVFNY